MNLNKWSGNRGDLTPIEFDTLPFVPKRMFYITNVPPNTERGGHAHRTTRQIIICLQGKILIKTDDGHNRQEHFLEPNQYMLLDNLIWSSQFLLEPDSILLSLCSTIYDKNDYINDLQEFYNILQTLVNT